MENGSYFAGDLHANPHQAPAALTLTLQASASCALTPREARVARLLSDERLHALLVLELGIHGWSVSAPGAFEAETPGYIELRCADQSACVAIDLSDWPALASAALPADADAHRAQAGLNLAVASILLQPLCTALATLGLDAVRIAALHAAPPPRARACHTVSMRVSQQSGAHTLRFGIVDAADGWLDAFEELLGTQCVPYTPRVSQLAVPGRVEIGARTLNVAALESLRPGDIVMRALAHPAATLFGDAPQPLRLSLVWGNPGMRQLRCAALADANTLTLTGTPYMSQDAHDDNLSPAEPCDPPLPIGELDLPVKIEIDTVSLPVAQLSALRAGYVLELPVPVRDAQVKLVSYGQVIAHGELVAVGEHIGVRIIRIANQSVPV